MSVCDHKDSGQVCSWHVCVPAGQVCVLDPVGGDGINPCPCPCR